MNCSTWVGRVEAQNEMKISNEDILFPHKRVGKTKVYSLPSDDEINQTIAAAKHEAIQLANTFGMTNLDGIDSFDFKFKVDLCMNEDEESDAESGLEK